MARNTTTTPGTVNTAALDALSPEMLAERQRTVDLAVRRARRDGLCETVESFLREIYPEMAVTETDRYGNDSYQFYSNDGVSCRGRSLATGVRTYDADGYDPQGYDRDGWARSYNRDGDALRPGRAATAEETAAEAAALAAVINPTTYKPTA